MITKLQNILCWFIVQKKCCIHHCVDCGLNNRKLEIITRFIFMHKPDNLWAQFYLNTQVYKIEIKASGYG